MNGEEVFLRCAKIFHLIGIFKNLHQSRSWKEERLGTSPFFKSSQVPRKGGWRTCMPRPLFEGVERLDHGRGLTCIPFPNILLIKSMAIGTPIDASIPRNPPYCPLPITMPRPTRRFSTAFSVLASSFEQVCRALFRSGRNRSQRFPSAPFQRRN